MKRYRNMLRRRHQTNVSVRLAILLAMVGGFLDAYTYLCRGQIFANAQTGNMVLLGISLANKEYIKALLYLVPIIAFAIGVLVSHIIKDSNLNNPEAAILIFEIIIIACIVIFGTNLNDNIVNAVISFIASVQVSSFRKLVSFPYCSTMCTGNLRTATDSIYKAYKTKDLSLIKKGIMYLCIIFCFILGASIGTLLSINYSDKALIGAIILLFASFLLFMFENSSNNEKAQNL